MENMAIIIEENAKLDYGRFHKDGDVFSVRKRIKIDQVPFLIKDPMQCVDSCANIFFRDIVSLQLQW